MIVMSQNTKNKKSLSGFEYIKFFLKQLNTEVVVTNDKTKEVKKIKVWQLQLRFLPHWFWYRTLHFSSRAKLIIGFFLLIVAALIPLPRIGFILFYFHPEDNAKEILTVLITSLASILGIVGALILIIFQVSKKTFVNHALSTSFRTGILGNTFLLYVFSMLYATTTFLTLCNMPLNDISYRALWVSIFLFFACIVFLFIAIKKILSSTYIEDQVKFWLSKLRGYDIQELRGLSRGATVFSDYLSNLQENPLFIIQEGGVLAVRDGDTTGASFVIAEVSDYLLSALNSNQDKRELIDAFLTIYNSIAQEAIIQRNEPLLSLLIDEYKRIYLYSAKNKVSYENLLELDGAFEQLIGDSIEAHLDEPVGKAIYAIEYIMETQLKENSPSADELWEWDGGNIKTEDIKNNDHSKGLHWQHISEDYMRLIASIADRAMENKRINVLRNALSTFTRLASMVIGLRNLSDGMKERIIRMAYYYATSETIKSFDRGLWNKMDTPVPIMSYDVTNIISARVSFANEILMRYSELLLELTERGAMTAFTLNDYRAFASGLSRDIKKDQFSREALTHMIEVLDKMRVKLEGKIHNDTNAKLLYLELHSQTKSLIKWVEQVDKRDPLIKKIKEILHKYKYLKEAKEDEKNNSLEWPTIHKKKK